jgi:hypothetical protein
MVNILSDMIRNKMDMATFQQDSKHTVPDAGELLAILKVYPTDAEILKALEATDQQVRQQLEHFGFGPTLEAFPDVLAAHLGKTSSKIKSTKLHQYLLTDRESGVSFVLEEVGSVSSNSKGGHLSHRV